MADFINTVDVLGDDAVTDSIINRKITECRDDSFTKIGQYAFYQCTALTAVDFPAVTSIDQYAFANCSILASVNGPRVTSIGKCAFDSCRKNASLNFPVVTTIDEKGLYQCTAMTRIDLPNVTSIGSWALGGTNLATLILRNTTRVATLIKADGLKATPIASGTGYIYVPSALVDSYKAATNWSTYAAQFRALEDYTVDGTITGELDTTKI